jgi:hypothetical protein
MGDNGGPNKLRSVSINLGETEGRIEKLLSKESAPARVRISCWSQGHLRSRPLDISETELIRLLQQAIRAGILSSEFIGNLHSEFEI